MLPDFERADRIGEFPVLPVERSPYLESPPGKAVTQEQNRDRYDDKPQDQSPLALAFALMVFIPEPIVPIIHRSSIDWGAHSR
jgi:hypothetical protein